MQLQKIHIVVAVLLFVYGFLVMIGFSISISNKQACKDDLPIYPTPGCNYDGAQAIIFIILALLSVLAAPLGFFITYWVYTLPALFSAISIIMNIVYMLRYRTNNNWKFQLQQGKKQVWANQMRYLAMSCAFFFIVFILFFFGKLRNQLTKKELDEAAKDLQAPQRIHNGAMSNSKKIDLQLQQQQQQQQFSPRINQDFDQDTTQNQINNHVFK